VKAISAGDFHSLAVAEWLDQTISFDPLPNRTWGYPGFFTVSAAASSGLPVSFSASGNCFLASGSFVFISSAGSCTVTAAQPGGLNYNPAPDLARTFAIARAPQSITFAPLADKTYGDADFTVNASASSGSAVTFAARGNCTLSGATVQLTDAGSCTVTASEPGSVNYEPAPDVSRRFAIANAEQSIAPAPCKVPKVVGKQLASAKRSIGTSHCRTGRVVYANSGKRKKGVVISQSRRPGQVLPARSKINLIVSRGRRR
jgi:PASTA domain